MKLTTKQIEMLRALGSDDPSAAYMNFSAGAVRHTGSQVREKLIKLGLVVLGTWPGDLTDAGKDELTRRMP